MLNWLNQFNIFCLLDNHQYSFSDTSFEFLAGAGCKQSLKSSAENSLSDLDAFIKHENDWAFGHFAYDLKNEVENLSSQNFDGIEFPEMFFFIPEIILQLKKNTLQIGVIDTTADKIYKQILTCRNSPYINICKTNIKSRFFKEEYLSTVNKIKEHIQRGDCYELNFCQEFYSDDTIIDPLQVYKNLSKISPNPFAAFYKLNDKYLLCFSPERYLKKEADKIFSQPIKGTSKRDKDAVQDAKNKKYLRESMKELSENVMVVDLVRNDLNKICKPASVKVEELFGIYSYPQVHQMYSTITGSIDKNVSISQIIKATFPMGSMTGMPKKSVMQLIEKYEKTKRGLFSGAIGYFTPSGNFDFNVVIRSILYNSTKKYVSMQAGSAITFYSNAESEYEECLLKLSAMEKALE